MNSQQEENHSVAAAGTAAGLHNNIKSQSRKLWQYLYLWSHLWGLFSLQFPDHLSLLSNLLIEAGGSRGGATLDRGGATLDRGGGFLSWGRLGWGCSRLVVLTCDLFILCLQGE